MSNNQKFTAFQFDATQVAPSAPLEPVQAGFYNVAITDGEVVPTADGSGQRFKFELTILDGDCKGRKVWDGLNIANKSAQAQEIAHQQLSAICHATGTFRLTDVQELYNKPFTAKVGFEGQRTDPATGQTYEARNTFKGAKPLTNGAAPAGAPANGAAPGGIPAPAWVKPAGSAPSAAPATPAAPLPAAPTQPPFPTAPAAAPSAPRPPAPAPVQYRDELVMTAKANGMTKADFVASDAAWTDALLISEGYAEMKKVPVTPAAPVAQTPAGAPVAPWLTKK